MRPGFWWGFWMAGVPGFGHLFLRMRHDYVMQKKEVYAIETRDANRIPYSDRSDRNIVYLETSGRRPLPGLSFEEKRANFWCDMKGFCPFSKK